MEEEEHSQALEKTLRVIEQMKNSLTQRNNSPNLLFLGGSTLLRQ